MQIVSLETICIKCQNLFSGENKKKCHQFVVCWISQESGEQLRSLLLIALMVYNNVRKQSYHEKNMLW